MTWLRPLRSGLPLPWHLEAEPDATRGLRRTACETTFPAGGEKLEERTLEPNNFDPRCAPCQAVFAMAERRRPPRRLIAEYSGGPYDGQREDMTGKPGLTAHPPLIGGPKGGYLLDHVSGDVGYYRVPSADELDRPFDEVFEGAKNVGLAANDAAKEDTDPGDRA